MKRDNFDYYQEMTPDGFKDAEKPASRSQVYSYKGYIMRYNNLLASNWSAETTAVSQAQAVNNILSQAKKAIGLDYSAGGVKIDKAAVKKKG